MSRKLLIIGLAILLVLPGAFAIDGAFVNKSGATWTFVSNVYFADGGGNGKRHNAL